MNKRILAMAVLAAISLPPALKAQCSIDISLPFHAALLSSTAYVDVGANGNGTVYAINSEGVTIIQNGQNLPGPVPPVPPGLTTAQGRIAAAPDGTIYVVTDQKAMLKLAVPEQGLPWGQWYEFPGQTANDITVDYSGTPWIIGTHAVGGGYNILYYNGSTWTAIEGGAVRIAAAPSSGVANTGIWVVNNSQQIIHWNGGSNWQGYPGKAYDIGIDAATGFPWVIGTYSEGSGYAIYAYGQNGWLADSADVPGGLKGIAGGGNNPAISCTRIAYFTDASGRLWQVTPTQP